MTTHFSVHQPIDSELWRPTATKALIQARGKLLQQIREFFNQRDVLEVDTPILSRYGTTDPYIESIQTTHGVLQTSPEFAMKRLLCAGMGSIYQISKAFRQEQSGRLHNPEFTLLEWYRVGFTHVDLIGEIDAFLIAILGTESADIISYQQVFIDYLELDPLTSSDQTITNKVARSQVFAGDISALSKDDQLTLLFTHFIEPKLGIKRPVVVFGFPANQSALARINQQDNRIADRFEVYFKGIELANGFYELADADEQLRRFEADNDQRALKQLRPMPIDNNLINALKHGLPDCAGVALGVDRLLMLKNNLQHIEQVLCFPHSWA